MLWGAWQAVLPDLAADRQLSSGPLGAILTLGFVASFPAMIGAGRLVDRVGAGWAIAVAGIAIAAALSDSERARRARSGENRPWPGVAACC